MPETRVIANAVPKPGNESKVKELLHGMVAPSLAEPGVLTYDLHETLDGKSFRECRSLRGTQGFGALSKSGQGVAGSVGRTAGDP